MVKKCRHYIKDEYHFGRQYYDERPSENSITVYYWCGRRELNFRTKGLRTPAEIESHNQAVKKGGALPLCKKCQVNYERSKGPSLAT